MTHAEGAERIRIALALQKLANALGVKLDANASDADCLEALVVAADQAGQAKRALDSPEFSAEYRPYEVSGATLLDALGQLAGGLQ